MIQKLHFSQVLINAQSFNFKSIQYLKNKIAAFFRALFKRLKPQSKYIATATLLLITITSFAQLSGSYTIGGEAPGYTSLTEAANALSLNGIDAPVVFNIRSGEYNEQVAIEEIVGSSSTNTITFKSETNDAADVTINHDASSSKNYLIKLEGADHIVIKDLTFEASSSSYNDIIYLDNGTDNITIANCIFTGSNNSGV